MDNSTFHYTDTLGKPKSITMLGHRVLVRRCERDQNEFLVGQAEGKVSREAQLMVDAMTKKGWCHWCHVLAIGPNAGQPRTDSEMAKFKRVDTSTTHKGEKYVVPWGIDLSKMKPGDFVVVPEVSETNTQWRGVTGYEYDCMTDVTNLIAWIPEDNSHVPNR